MTEARPFNSWDALKLLALALMIFDHIGHFFFPQEIWIRAIGRSAMPVFLFLVGFAASYRMRWDIVALGAALSLYNFTIDTQFHALNILLTIAACRLILEAYEAPERRMKRPLEWFVICLFWVFTMALLQYGTLALMIALCGYMKRFSTDFTRRQCLWFWGLSFLACGAVQAYVSEFSTTISVLTAITLAATALLLWKFEIKPLPLPAKLEAPAKWTARHMAYIYAGHLALFMALSGVPF